MFSLLILSFCKLNYGEIINNISIENNRELHFDLIIEPLVKFEYEEHINNTENIMRDNFLDYDVIMITDEGECVGYENPNTVILNSNCDENEAWGNIPYDELLLNHEVYFKAQHYDFIMKLIDEGECFNHEFDFIMKRIEEGECIRHEYPNILLFNVNCIMCDYEPWNQYYEAVIYGRDEASIHQALRNQALKHQAYLYIYNLDGLGGDLEWEELIMNETITYYEHKDKNRNHVYEDKVKVLTRFFTSFEFVGDIMYRKKLTLLRDRFLEKNSTKADHISKFLKLKKQPLIIFNHILFGTWEVSINLFIIFSIIMPLKYKPHYLKIIVLFESILFAFYILE